MDGRPKRTNVVQMMVPEVIMQGTESASDQYDCNENDNDKDHHGLHQRDHNHHFSTVPILTTIPTTSTPAAAIASANLPVTTVESRIRDTHRSLPNELRKLFWQAVMIWSTLCQRKFYQKLMLTLLFSGLLTIAAYQRGFVYTPPEDVIVYCVVYSVWVTTCLPWLLLNLDGKKISMILGVLLRLFAADIGVLGYAAFRGDTHVFHRGLRLKPVMETSLSWLSEAGYSLRFAVLVASATASIVKVVVDVAFTKPAWGHKNQEEEPAKYPEPSLQNEGLETASTHCSRLKTESSSHIMKHKIVKNQPLRKRVDRLATTQENLATRPPNKGNNSTQLPVQRKNVIPPVLSRGNVENHSLLTERNVANRTSTSSHRKITSDSPKKNVTNPPSNGKNSASNSPPGKPRDGITYSRISKEKKGSSREGSVDLKPWKKTNPTIFSPAKSWQHRNDAFDRSGRFMRMGENISFNKKVEVDESNMTQHLSLKAFSSYVGGKDYGGSVEREDEGIGEGVEKERDWIPRTTRKVEGGGGGGGREVGRGFVNENQNKEETDIKLGHLYISEQPLGKGGCRGGYYERELMKRKMVTRKESSVDADNTNHGHQRRTRRSNTVPGVIGWERKC